MKRKSTKRKLFGILLTIVFCLSVLSPVAPAKAEITGNDSLANAYIHGLWSNTYTDTTIIAENQEAAYYKFTVNKGDRIFARVSYNNNLAGMSVDLLNSAGIQIDTTANVHDPDSVIPFMAINCDGIKDGQTFYLRINRGTVDPSKAMYVSYSFRNRIRTGSKAFNISGTASNPGNNPYNVAGVDSSVLTINLTNNTQIPNEAIVEKVTTSGTQSPSQGGVRHKIMPSNPGGWYTSIVKNASSGSYNISLSDGIEAKQIWKFKY
ncbi:MAG TPA: hypothetical protein DEG06_07745, partial [Lachnospiraceae bacterium]|nr:hypothetical protein [Lachnospiraceae bacterium]HBY72119.1 hypothetical protein [Lachnospiraceae bacterium]